MTPFVSTLLLQLALLLWTSSPDKVVSVNKSAIVVEQEALELFKEISYDGLSRNAFLLAYEGYFRLRNQNKLSRDSILTIIDFSKPSHEERFFILDIKNKQIIEHALVAHGKNTGIVNAQRFSNTPHSNQSSLGFFVTDKTYKGKHGYSLRIKGVETDINNKAYQRAIVIHGAHYVSQDYIQKNGRLGRSFGCPALSYELSEEAINQIKGQSCLFIYAPDEDYLQRSQLINSSYYSQIISE